MNNDEKFNNLKKYLIAETYLYESNFSTTKNLINNSVRLKQQNHIPELPNELSINGCLDINSTNIKVLPKKLNCYGYLDISNTQIEELPEELVCSSLYLLGTKIKHVPDYAMIGVGIVGCKKYETEYIGGYLINHEEGFSVLIPKTKFKDF